MWATVLVVWAALSPFFSTETMVRTEVALVLVLLWSSELVQSAARRFQRRLPPPRPPYWVNDASWRSPWAP